MAQEIKIEKKASEVIQPTSDESAREAIQSKQDLSGANLVGMALKGLSAFGAILRKTNLSSADLSHGLLVNPNLFKAHLHGTAMHNTVVLGGDLVRTRFEETDLHESALIGVNAQEASFRNANLRKAGVIGANLRDADFTGADMTEARLASSNVEGADFTDVDLSGARAHKVDWAKAKVPPATMPAPLFNFPKWGWVALIGGIFSALALIIYLILHGRKKEN